MRAFRLGGVSDYSINLVRGILPKALEESGVPVEYDVLKIAKP